MSAPSKPLFRPEALRPKLAAFTVPAPVLAARGKLAGWVTLLASPKGKAMKETELLPIFIGDIFGELLGYTGPAGNAAYTIKRESLVEVAGKFADAALGQFFTTTQGDRVRVAFEGKGPTDPLDRPFKNRKYSAVEQALLYAVNFPCDWYIVTNLNEVRLYHKGHDQFTYERFAVADLAQHEEAFRRFVFLLGAARVVQADGTSHLDGLLSDSQRIGRELTNEYYCEYRLLREQTFRAIHKANPKHDPAFLLAATQKILDRILFIAFCEDRDLLPKNIIARAYEHTDAFHQRPIWDNFIGLFRSVDKGNKALDIWRYNGGLFAPDEPLEALNVPDEVCDGFKKLAEYEYGTHATGEGALIDVEILGHVFEQSISDLEEMQNDLAGRTTVTKAKEQKKNARKEAGAFYTPGFITRYIVQQTLGPLLDERFERLRVAHEGKAAKTARKVLTDPTAFDSDELTKPQTKALETFWEAWVTDLESVRIVDPACGSGAFLIETFDQLFAEYQKAQAYLVELRGPTLFDIRKTILEHNLYGVDLNGEAVEIARLSCWIKTAEYGKALTSLDHNIRIGNSVVTDPTIHPKAFRWDEAFPEVFAAGGFDVVVGNPPYVRQEWIKDFKPHWEARFASYRSAADLFVYFYELGVNLLKPGGRLGYITSGGWVRGSYGEGLRDFLAHHARLDSMIDFGEYQPFDDAEMIRPTIAIVSKQEPGGPMRLWKWLTNGKPPENLSDIIKTAPLMRTDHLGSDVWELEADDVRALKSKMASSGCTLAAYTNGQIYRGVVTGANEVFVITDEKRKELIAKHSRSAEIIKPFVQGTHLRDWCIEDSGDYLIFPRRGIRIEDYPAVLEYLTQHRATLEPKPDGWDEDHANKGKNWPGRKGGSYQWYEIQDSIDYWPAFEKPKIVYPDITNYPRFCMDFENRYLGNTGFIVPLKDWYLLGILGSWASWFFISKTAQPLRLRSSRWQYRLFTQFVEVLPIPDAPPTEREAIAKLAERCNTLGTQRYRLEEQVRGRLVQGFRTDPATKLNEKAQEWWEHPLNDLGDALRTSFKLKKNPFASPTTADEWEPYLNGKRQEADTLRRQLADAEAEINDRVFKLFKLTADEVRLLLREVEH